MQLEMFSPWPEMPERLAAVCAARLVNIARDRRARDADDVVYVGRTFAGMVDAGFGNPFPAVQGRPTAVIEFRRWLDRPDGAAVRARVLAGELRGRRVGCWCHPKPCHGAVLLAFDSGLVAELDEWLEALAAAG